MWLVSDAEIMAAGWPGSTTCNGPQPSHGSLSSDHPILASLLTRPHFGRAANGYLFRYSVYVIPLTVHRNWHEPAERCNREWLNSSSEEDTLSLLTSLR